MAKGKGLENGDKFRTHKSCEETRRQCSGAIFAAINSRTPRWFSVMLVSVMLVCTGALFGWNITAHAESSREIAKAVAAAAQLDKSFTSRVDVSEERIGQIRRDIAEIKSILKEQRKANRLMEKTLIQIEARLPK